MTVALSERRRRETRGRGAEARAAWALRLKGYRVLARRLRGPAGEIDLVVTRGRLVAAVEVKARPAFAAGMAAVSAQQQRRIARSLAFWLARHDPSGRFRVRFDVVVVVPWRWPRHVADAWRPEAGMVA